MAIDNFKLISTLLDFSEPNTFYFVQVLKRKKENPEMKNGSKTINQYYIYSPEDLEKLREKIVEDCVVNNARAYINPNRLNSESIAIHTVKIIADYIIRREFKSVRNAYATACGNFNAEDEKRWVIDIDEDFLDLKDEIVMLVSYLHAQVKNKSYKIIAEVPTKSGVHLISNPFNLQEFNDKILLKFNRKIDINKNSPTILYIA